MGKLTPLAVKSAKAGRHADGDGLYLLVKPTGAMSWLLRVQVEGEAAIDATAPGRAVNPMRTAAGFKIASDKGSRRLPGGGGIS